MIKRSVLLNKIKETDEDCLRSKMTDNSEGKTIQTLKKGIQKKLGITMNVTENERIRPKSSGWVYDVKSWKTIKKMRPNSSCAFGKHMTQNGTCPDRYTHQNHFPHQEKNRLANLNRRTTEKQQIGRSKSTSDILGSSVKVFSPVFYNGNPLSKFKRSLKLLGLDLPDISTYYNKAPEVTWKKKRSLPTLSTRLIRRTISLDSLGVAVREAWTNNCLGFYQRKILSHAAYEEWYFRKKREWQIKQKEKKMEAFKNQEKICQDYVMKKVRAEEEFRKWVLRKRRKKKENDENSIKTFDKKSRKTKEEINKALLKWKKDKDKELKEKIKKKKREEENNRESERQKMERKIIAEKAFQQWKKNLINGKNVKEKKDKKTMSGSKKDKKKRESQISFQIWKATKDEAIRLHLKDMRAAKIKRKERLTLLEDKSYEAEQVFEEWLKKKCFRKQTNIEPRQKNIPWIPV